jgi:hypothetical protein
MVCQKQHQCLAELTTYFIAVFQLFAFGLITELYHRGRYAPFDDAKLSE